MLNHSNRQNQRSYLYKNGYAKHLWTTKRQPTTTEQHMSGKGQVNTNAAGLNILTGANLHLNPNK